MCYIAHQWFIWTTRNLSFRIYFYIAPRRSQKITIIFFTFVTGLELTSLVLAQTLIYIKQDTLTISREILNIIYIYVIGQYLNIFVGSIEAARVECNKHYLWHLNCNEKHLSPTHLKYQVKAAQNAPSQRQTQLFWVLILVVGGSVINEVYTVQFLPLGSDGFTITSLTDPV